MVELRSAKPYDWPDIEDLFAMSKQAAGLGIKSIKSIKGAIIAEESGAFVGAVIIELLGEVGILSAVAVHLDWQGHGVATALVSRAVAQAAMSGIGRIFAAADDGEGFLLAAGFELERDDLVPLAVRSRMGSRVTRIMSLDCKSDVA